MGTVQTVGVLELRLTKLAAVEISDANLCTIAELMSIGLVRNLTHFAIEANNPTLGWLNVVQELPLEGA